MSAKFKFFLIVISSIFATVTTVVYLLHRKPMTALRVSKEPLQQLSTTDQAHMTVENTERANYNPIPLQSINSPLQGSDPADLAINAFDEAELKKVTRKVEVAYPQQNQAFVTITQTKQVNNQGSAIKYRVELATFGRSLFVKPPRVWQIVWAGIQVQCSPESNNRRSVPAKLFTRCMRSQGY